jgi:hypothetical protein
MKMTPIENPQNDAVAAIARWEDEGGAFKSSASKTGAEASKVTPGPPADGRASQKVDRLSPPNQPLIVRAAG